MNGFEDIEKKIKDSGQHTSSETDQRILEDSFTVLEQVPRSEQKKSEKSTFVFAAAVITICAILVLFFIFNKPSQPQKTVITPDITPAVNINEPNESKSDADKLKNEIEKIAALARQGDVNGLLVILNEGSMPSRILAAGYLAKLNDPRAVQYLKRFNSEAFRQDANDTSSTGDKDRQTDANVLKSEDINDSEKIADGTPRIISVYPPSGSELSLVSELEIVFDRPMDTNDFEVINPYTQKDDSVDFGVFYNYVEYIAAQNKFVLPFKLPNNWNGSVRFQNFVSVDGLEAEPLTVNYHTRQKPFSESLLVKFKQSLESKELIELLRNIKESRLRLNSLSETVYMIMWYEKGREKTHEADFKFQGSNQFYADISGIMEIPFYLACDGNNCWLYSGNQDKQRLMTVAFEDINEINVEICNPFGIKDADILDVIQKYNLQYEQIEPVDTQQCYLIRSWRAEADNLGTNCSISSWWFDITTFMPVQIFFDYGGDDSKLVRFIYHSINELMSDDVFTYQPLTSIEPNFAEPLGEGYDNRFLNCVDGSTNGRMSVNWGKKGSKGTSSTGLN